MAALQHRNGSYRVLFRYHGKQHSFTLGEVSSDEAENKVRQVDYLLMRLDQRLATVPSGVHIVEYLQFDGRPATVDTPTPEKLTVIQLRDKYLATNQSSLEPSTHYTARLHLTHFVKALGKSFPMQQLTLSDLQDYVNRRAAADGLNGRKVSAVTIKKEVTTLRSAWHWAARMNLLSGRCPSDGLRYPRTSEKPPFQTIAEIERQLEGLTDQEQAELWHCLYLLLPEIDDLLKTVKKNAREPWVYPVAVFAAHTGARRSEMLRAGIHDVKLDDATIILHERKRKKGTNTTRRVPMTRELMMALKQWLSVHPGGKALFCQVHDTDDGSKEVRPLTKAEIHNHFIRALKASKWRNLKGLHCLRHSFCSNLAMRGVDQRMIDELVGHQTAEQQKRYRHLAPHTKAATLTAVFG